ncbi:hypothetical protein FRC00_012075, partial [Tulasnella sp. 408]
MPENEGRPATCFHSHPLVTVNAFPLQYLSTQPLLQIFILSISFSPSAIDPCHMAFTPQHIFEFANILKRRTSSDEELYTKIGNILSFADQWLVKLGSEKTDPGNPIWFAVRSADIVGLLLDIATNGKKNEGAFERGTALNHARVIAILRLSEFVSVLDFSLYANKDLTDDLIQRVPRILEIYENAIQGQDPQD